MRPDLTAALAVVLLSACGTVPAIDETTSSSTGGDPATTSDSSSSNPAASTTSDGSSGGDSTSSGSTDAPSTSEAVGSSSGTTGEPDLCGNGIQDDGEECDDANQIDSDFCTTACTLAACGDNVVQLGIEGCDDGNLVDGDACPSTCQPAVCGDGFTWAGEEECDDGVNAGGYGGCQPDCTHAPACGDGIIQDGDGEECDNDGDSCVACKKAWRIVFVSSKTYAGDIGGLVVADAQCQELADAADLSGTFRAWLSDGVNGPATRFLKSTVPYRLPSGAEVAADWTDLTTGAVSVAISKTESGGPAPPGYGPCGDGNDHVWSNTNGDGTSKAPVCGGFTTTLGNGAWGRWSTTSNWTGWCSGGGDDPCGLTSPIYCFEQ